MKVHEYMVPVRLASRSGAIVAVVRCWIDASKIKHEEIPEKLMAATDAVFGRPALIDPSTGIATARDPGPTISRTTLEIAEIFVREVGASLNAVEAVDSIGIGNVLYPEWP